MVKKTVAALLAMPLAASLLLAGCGGGDPKPAAASSTTRATSPTTSPTPTTPRTSAPSTSPTTSPAGDLGIPTAARAHTPAGAEAFVRHFLAQSNKAWTAPQPGLVAALSTPACQSCKGLEQGARDLAQKNHRYGSDPISTRSLGAISFGKSTSTVFAALTQHPAKIVTVGGQVVSTEVSKDLRRSFELAWTSNSWRITAIKVVR